MSATVVERDSALPPADIGPWTYPSELGGAWCLGGKNDLVLGITGLSLDPCAILLTNP
jgi:hypothetical protein